MSHEDLVALLSDVAQRVRTGDSFEGFIQWLLPEDRDAPARSFDVLARYRIGNTMGQGGMRIVGIWGNAELGEPGH
jgi:hypothetical protein